MDEEKNSIDYFFQDTKEISLLTKEEERNLVRQKRKWDIALANIRYVVVLAKRYAKSGVALEDLIQVGILGFHYGLSKYKLDMGTGVLSYCSQWAKQRMERLINNQKRTIRIPINALRDISRMETENYRNKAERGSYLTERGLAEKTWLELYKVKRLLAVPKETGSLDYEISEEGNKTLHDIVGDGSVDVEEEFMASCLHSDIDRTLKRVLKDREYKIMKLSYGLNGDFPMNLREVGVVFKITKERVRQIRNKALKKIRNCEDAENLREYLN